LLLEHADRRLRAARIAADERPVRQLTAPFGARLRPATAWARAGALASALAATLAAASACHKKTAPVSNDEAFAAGMRAYLDARGTLCLGKPSWPIDVTAPDALHRTRDALQMPVLEHLGVVASTDTTVDVDTGTGRVPVEAKRYQLTAEGRRYFVVRPKGGGRNDGVAEQDLCVARLALDRIVRVQLAGDDAGARSAVVTYTYRVDAPAWTRDPEFQRVLPAIARVVSGGGSNELTEGFTWTGADGPSGGWVANELLASSGGGAP
jgi:hypothetical protein